VPLILEAPLKIVFASVFTLFNIPGAAAAAAAAIFNNILNGRFFKITR
jgi:hypothetical protein